MKKFGLLALVVLIAGAVQAQSTYSGFRAGLNLATISGSDVNDAEMKVGFQAGGVFLMPFTKEIGLQSGLLFSSKGYSTSMEIAGVNNTYSATTYTIEVPINIAYGIGDEDAQFQIFAGPYLGVFLMGSYKSESTIGGQTTETTGDIESDDISTLDLGLNFGVGYKMDALLINAGYGLGLTTLDPDGEMDMKNAVIQITAAYLMEL